MTDPNAKGEPEVMKDPITWQHAAQQIGEYLADTGPDGYYAMRADEWLSWARARMSEKLTAIAQRDAAVRERDEMYEALVTLGITKGEVNWHERWWHIRPDGSEAIHDNVVLAADALWADYRAAIDAARTPTPPQEATNDDA